MKTESRLAVKAVSRRRQPMDFFFIPWKQIKRWL